MPGRIVTGAVLFLVAAAGWALVFGGGWILYRGVFLYEWDPVLMGTGGGLAAGGLGVVALVQTARAQIATARNTAAILERMERGAGGPLAGPPQAPRRPPPLTGERRDD